MNDKQRAKLTMLQAALGVLDDHADLFTPNKAFGKAHQELSALVARLDPTAERQQAAVTPEQPGAVKKATRLLLAQRAGDMAAALLALADELADIRLHTDSDYTESQLARKPDADLLRIAQNLHARATDHAQALAEQDVTADELSELQAAINAFKAEQAAPRLTVAEGKAHKQAINADLRQATALLKNRVDKFMVRFRRSQPQFHTAYQSARQTINTATRPGKNDKPDPGTTPPAG
ncbi:hypothetical protein EJV47_12415 [Hymenobacter gummosus]|uniref:Uncharacterized protein n=1 Tax=Hymenobacter gummosus TaxID=1776032 RepID=A0A431U2M8_9BACT|nr:hypothetical protein [Hymenobacter gummosus]RTQ49614.1 hypothetical protein EJV47_12415 [Hymenobacter gummosus]